ncbi:hypothetical protein [Brevibacterium renqingii]|uniref:hypothetical protein n=1 Tax=Brevibacterium renqingii TaxID=2776916 RepID=UPI001ADF9268|nr:hypothetical protein [Brevibacterium renqingii]
MVNFARHNRRPPLFSCLIAAFVFVAVGVTVLLVVILVLVGVADDSVTGDAGTPDATSTAPATGGWSGEG